MRLRTFVFAAFVAVAPLGGAWGEGAIAVDDQSGSKPSDAGYGIGFGQQGISAGRCPKTMQSCRQRFLQSRRLVLEMRRLRELGRKIWDRLGRIRGHRQKQSARVLWQFGLQGRRF